MNWAMMGFGAKTLGLLLVFVGTLVGVVGLNPTTSPNTNIIDGAVLATRVLWTIGLAAIAAGAGIKLQFVIGTPAGDLQEGHSRVVRASQWRNTATFLVALVLLVWIMTFLPV
ncbi:MAG: hypothetical protein ACREDE_08255 [Thermoplasmata archaeon]